MPKIRRQDFPPALLNHLLDRIAEREISFNQLGLFGDWLVTEPEVGGSVVQAFHWRKGRKTYEKENPTES
jgi:hypothetical protein